MHLEELLKNKCIVECLENKVRECDYLFYKQDELTEADEEATEKYINDLEL